MEFTHVLDQGFYDYAKKDAEVIAVLLFGSYARGEPYRDIDICVVLDKRYKNLKMSNKKIEYGMLLPSKFDISIFQQLPLYIRKRVLKEGKILFCKDEDGLYEIAFATIKEFEYYKKIYYTYLDAIENEK